jgi:formamidopyrimidine-DNA glycosylase
MPELPEVETIRRGLERALIGRVIENVQVWEQRSCPVSETMLGTMIHGTKICALKRRGKLLIIELNNNVSLLAHLRMTGQMIFKAGMSGETDSVTTEVETEGARAAAKQVGSRDCTTKDFGGGYPNSSFIGNLPDKTTRVIIAFEDGSYLYFNDQRKFGYIKPLKTDAVANDSFVASLGPEPLDTNFTAQDFASCLPRSSKRSVKSVLLDQSVIAGIGNIYADESLFLAGIMPDRLTNSLNDEEVSRLYVAIRNCLEQSIADGGSTMKDYVDSEGLRGEYLDLHAYVFNRTGQPCRKCGSIIGKTKVAGRGTHYCQNCQK